MGEPGPGGSERCGEGGGGGSPVGGPAWRGAGGARRGAILHLVSTPPASDPVEPGDASAESGGLEHLVADLRRLERHLGPALGSLENAGEHAFGEASHAALPAWRRLTSGEPRWPVSVAVLFMIALQLRLPDQLSPAGAILLPVVEFVLLVVLVVANPRRIDRRSPALRVLGLALIALASLGNGWSVALLVDGLVRGTSGSQPGPLLATGANIWLTNVIIFALWYWELDRGGPAARAAGADPTPDFLFPQMAETSIDFHGWEPQFTDYGYVSFTNATAFSPTDTMPLSRWAKLGMMLQSAISLVTAALVIARAVNILH